MDEDKLNELLTQYLTGTISRDELRRLREFLAIEDVGEIETVIEKLVEKDLQADQTHQKFDQDTVLQSIWKKIDKNRALNMRWTIAGAATFLVFFLLFFHHNRSKSLLSDKVVASSDISLPEQNQVILRLADGTLYDLTQTNQKTLQEIGVKVTTGDNGETVFTLAHPKIKNTGINTVTNGKGYTCQLLLADGSRIWLNAGASLSYPSQFAKSQRHVTLEGEAFFDVAHNVHSPFKVSTAQTIVRVLGTQFNLASDRSTGTTRATLVEGSVEVSNGSRTCLLDPGWQATVDGTAQEISTDTVNLRDVMAWKEGYFRFNDHTIEEVMTQVAAWYNVEPIYSEKPTADRFTGSISKTQKLSDVLLQLAEISNYRFKIKERSVYIMK